MVLFLITYVCLPLCEYVDTMKVLVEICLELGVTGCCKLLYVNAET